jgi:hypothetical protein
MDCRAEFGIKPHEENRNERVAGGLKRSLAHQFRPTEKAELCSAFSVEY